MHSINPDAARAGGTALTPLVPLVRAVVADQRRRYEGSTITLKGASGDPRVALGENDLRSVVGNLVVNALEVSGGKGPVDVRLRSDADRVHLRVADKGPGLPAGDVFAAFFSTKSSGTGLRDQAAHEPKAEAGATRLGAEEGGEHVAGG